jgi:hypothetical protein
VAVPPSVHAFRVAKLKEMGATAWRTAHNHPDPRLLDACDAAGSPPLLEPGPRTLCSGGTRGPLVVKLERIDRLTIELTRVTCARCVLVMPWVVDAYALFSGLLVLLENDRNDASEEGVRSLSALLMRNRHRPSVIGWCACATEHERSLFPANISRVDVFSTTTLTLSCLCSPVPRQVVVQ